MTNLDVTRLPRRKRTLPIASAGGPEPKVTITSRDWATLESALGKTIPTKLRQEVVELTNNFLSFAIFELTAEPVEGATARIRALFDSANAFWRALFSGNRSDAAFYGEHLVALHFHDSRIGDRDKLHTLNRLNDSSRQAQFALASIVIDAQKPPVARRLRQVIVPKRISQPAIR